MIVLGVGQLVGVLILTLLRLESLADSLSAIVINLIAFIPVYLWELIKANFSVAIKSLSPKIDINPGIVKITTDLNSDYGLAMLSNCITLTPGTITMDIYEDEDNINIVDREDTEEKIKLLKHQIMKIEKRKNEYILKFDTLQNIEIKEQI